MEKFNSGFAAIVGRPNVGKSTLMNKLIGEKIAIVSNKPQTTRNTIQCILTTNDYQIIFIDTPGLHKPKNELGEYMVQSAVNTLDEVDVILFLVDLSERIGGKGDIYIADMLNKVNTPVILAANKLDEATNNSEKETNDFINKYNFEHLIKISAQKKTNLDKLSSLLLKFLPEGPKYYPDDMITDKPERFIVAELVREKTLQFLREEVPHGISVEILTMADRDNKELIDISAVIYCEKKSHKGIILGRKGSMLKKIGTAARKDIEALLGCKVYLELWVKVREDWRKNSKDLKYFGYSN